MPPTTPTEEPAMTVTAATDTNTQTPVTLHCSECPNGMYRSALNSHGNHVCVCCGNEVAPSDFQFDSGERLVTRDVLLAYVTDWYVVIDRQTVDGAHMAPIAVGPFSEARADEECQSDGGIVYALLTDDCKAEGWIADDVFTQPGLPDRRPEVVTLLDEVVIPDSPFSLLPYDRA
jgi:hypothetical protein